MMNITRGDIDLRVKKAGKRLKQLNPVMPINPDNVLRVADEANLPIGSADMDHDVVARTVFISGFIPEATLARNAGIDGIFRVFQHGAASSAVR